MFKNVYINTCMLISYGFYTSRCSQKYTFALTGKTWSLLKQYCPGDIPKIITRASVFSRMSPDQKQQLIQELQDIGYYVGKGIFYGVKK